jgi:hypothetical protein
MPSLRLQGLNGILKVPAHSLDIISALALCALRNPHYGVAAHEDNADQG